MKVLLILLIFWFNSCKSTSPSNVASVEVLSQVKSNALPWPEIEELDLKDQNQDAFTLKSVEGVLTIVTLVTEESATATEEVSNRIGLGLKALSPSKSAVDVEKTQLYRLVVVTDISRMNFVKKRIAPQLIPQNFKSGIHRGVEYGKINNVEDTYEDALQRSRLLIDSTGDLSEKITGNIDDSDGLFAIMNEKGRLLELKPGVFFQSPQEVNVHEFVTLVAQERDRVYNNNHRSP